MCFGQKYLSRQRFLWYNYHIDDTVQEKEREWYEEGQKASL